LSVIIPALNAGEVLPATLAALAEAESLGIALDIVVADGGSDDGTAAAAAEAGATVIAAERGRGGQLRAAAAAASGDWFLFLHADTVLAAGWAESVRRFVGDPDDHLRAASFRFALDDTTLAARRIERLVRLRGRLLGLPYGDQGLLISRRHYEALGGFRPMPLMEDVDMMRRIGRRRIEILEAEALTSARRYREGGYWRRPLRNLACLGLYFLGVPPSAIARLYHR
jgi:rSAM/selenodomain-associated transferase 2